VIFSKVMKTWLARQSPMSTRSPALDLPGGSLRAIADILKWRRADRRRILDAANG